MSVDNSFPVVVNTSFAFTITFSGYLFEILGAWIFTIVSFIGYKLLFNPDLTCNCTILFSCPFTFKILFVITSCDSIIASSALSYGLTRFNVIFLSVFMFISFCVPSL